MVIVRVFGKKESRQVSLEEAQKILNETYDNPVGGIVVDAKTHEVLARIAPGVEEIVIIEQMLGGG